MPAVFSQELTCRVVLNLLVWQEQHPGVQMQSGLGCAPALPRVHKAGH